MSTLLPFAPGYPVWYRVAGSVLSFLTAFVGVFCLTNIRASVALLIVVVAIGWLLHGLVEIYLAAGSLRSAGKNWQFASGLALLLAGIAVLVWPKLGLAAFITIGATVLVFVGIGQVIVAVAGMRENQRAHA